jgi:tetratricopeptide (TPR) repeat protein
VPDFNKGKSCVKVYDLHDKIKKMKKGDSIKIRSSRQKEISTNVTIDGKKYLILTEDINPKENLVTTKVYEGGKILMTKQMECQEVSGTPAPEKKIVELIRRQHDMLLTMLKNQASRKGRTPSDFLDEVKTLLKKKNNKGALELLNTSLDEYPNDPFLLSYYGCLEAIINKNCAYGIDTCMRALEILNERIPFGQEVFYPTFCLNLGRAYIAGGKRKHAFDVFQKGLTYDKENKDLLWEMKKLGMRRKAVVPYLSRSNPINKYVGMILHTFRMRPS